MNGQNDSRNLVLRFTPRCIFWATSVADRVSATQRTRAQLHPALEQPDDSFVRQLLGDEFAHHVFGFEFTMRNIILLAKTATLFK